MRLRSALVAAALVACMDSTGPVTGLAIAPGSAVATLGTTLRFAASVRGDAGTFTNAVVAWASSDTTVATVDARGVASARAIGVATIRATLDTLTATATLTVASALHLSPDSLVTVPGVTFPPFPLLDSVGLPLSPAAVQWRSSDSAVAVASAAGVVTKTPGTASIIGTLLHSADTLRLSVARDSFTALAGGASAAAMCGITTAGAVCWGDDSIGAIDAGYGTTLGVPGPVGLAGGPFAHVSLGAAFGCGLSAAGAAWCWGSNLDGQLGDRTNVGGYEAQGPIAVTGGHTFQAIAAGGAHVCALDEGLALCWGADADGSVGVTPQPSVTQPTLVDSAPTLVAIAAGDHSSCGLATDSTAYCWGSNASGALGDSVAGVRYTAGAVHGAHKFIQLVAGGAFYCGLTSGGAAYCWGDNTVGQLGDANNEDSAVVPVVVSGGHVFAALAAGHAHACGVEAGGVAWCWGDNTFQQLGYATQASFSRIPDQPPNGSFWKAIAAGADLTCAIGNDARAYCWGNNAKGQIGKGLISAPDFVIVVGQQ